MHARELTDAAALEPTHPKIAVLKHRLTLAMNEQEATTEVAEVAKHSMSNDELDRMVRGMPEGTVELFSHTIQPMLLNNCTSSGLSRPWFDNELQPASHPAWSHAESPVDAA